MPVALLTACLFALTGVCATQASRLLGGAKANFWRLAIAAAILSLYAHLWGQGWGGDAPLWFFSAGAIGFGAGGYCMFQALRRTGSTLTLLVEQCAATLFAAAIGWVFLGASLTWLEIFLIFLILSGVVLGMSPGPLPNLPRSVLRTGVVFALMAALFQAISFNLSRHGFLLVAESGETLTALTAAYQRLVGGVIVALSLYGLTYLILRQKIFAPPARQVHPSPFPAPVWVIANALFGPVLGVSSMLWAIRLVENVGLVQAIAATATLLTVPLATLLEGARPQKTFYFGAILALVGVAALLLS
ncbi:MAG: DMT family transporter [Opitutales bacterium]|nr:DMT family transporter [Opitutales bacterium]